MRLIKLQDENRTKLAYRALALLTAARAPLTAEAMYHALGLAHVLDYQKGPSKLTLEEILEEIPNPESIIECCMGLIKMEPTTRVVLLAHYDILQEMQERWVEIFGSDQTARLAETCIVYLLLDDFSGGPCHDIATLRGRLEEHSFLNYASHYWGYHARTALLLDACKADFMDDIHRFLQQPMNLALSLQVSNYDPEGKPKTLAIDPDRFLGLSELQIASRHGLAAVVKDVLRMNPNVVSISDGDGRTALHEAAQAGWEDIVSMLIDAGADPSLMDDEWKTPFVYAAECGHAKVRSILERDYVRGDRRQQTLEEALCDAAEAGKTRVVKELLDLDVSPDAEKSSISAMTAALLKGHKQIIRLLLKKRASVSYHDGLPSDSIPLHQAIKNSHVEIAALLLDFGANIQTRDRLNRTALFETLGTPDIRGAALLLKNGIDISCRDSTGNTVLHEAARRGSVEHALRFVDRGVDIMLDQGTDLIERNNTSKTPLSLAVEAESTVIPESSIKRGADMNNLTTALSLAVGAGYVEILKLLLDHGAKFGSTTEEHQARELLSW